MPPKISSSCAAASETGPPDVFSFFSCSSSWNMRKLRLLKTNTIYPWFISGYQNGRCPKIKKKFPKPRKEKCQWFAELHGNSLPGVIIMSQQLENVVAPDLSASPPSLIRRNSSTPTCPRCKKIFMTRKQYVAHNDPASPNCCPSSLFPCIYQKVGCQAYFVRSALDGHQSTCPFKTVQQAQPFILPFGCIVMWVGTDPPNGWLVCDGKHGTPDLSSLFARLPDGTVVSHIQKQIQ